jgi:hypothetical protein
MWFRHLGSITTPLTISNRDGIAHLRNIDPYKPFGIIRHGSSSCDEDRLGPPEQPSDAQCRAEPLHARGGHTVLLCNGNGFLQRADRGVALGLE